MPTPTLHTGKQVQLFSALNTKKSVMMTANASKVKPNKTVTFGHTRVLQHKKGDNAGNTTYDAMNITSLFDAIRDMLDADFKQAILDFVNNKPRQPDLSWYEFGEILERIFRHARIRPVLDVMKVDGTTVRHRELTLKNVIIGHLLTHQNAPFKQVLSHYLESGDHTSIGYDFTIHCLMIIMSPTLYLHCKSFDCGSNKEAKDACRAIEHLVRSSYTRDNGWNEAFLHLFKKHYKTAYKCDFPGTMTAAGGRKSEKRDEKPLKA